ncbi:hypothetical protein [Nocardioides currus]|uniref:DUF3352 domain-containing protein n=1 Tax=Nocardioides currus TaxID=2133958 RepID=A0A2R7YYJ9_9ACTN|nr:hypothetical protein [Nocardioides currus]PUA81458.1 hypothetical protein C7S10_05065 [Nocardioides currus]
MLRRLPRRLVVALGAALVLVVVAVIGIRWWHQEHRTELARAVAMAPAATERLSWTDWRGVRRSLGVSLDARPSTDEVTAFLDEAFGRDLSPSSALVESAATLNEEFRFSPATIDWELLAQGAEGAVDILGLPEDTDFDALGDTLESLGFTRPSDETGVWVGGPDLLARIGPSLTPELQHFALLPDAGVVLTSDTEGYLEEALDSATGDGDHLTSVDEVVEAAGSPLAAAVYTGAYACEHLAMAAADDTDRAQADELIAGAGGVHPVSGFAMASQPDGEVTVDLSFETDDAARADADSRATLAAGPAPGQGGSFTDRFELTSATAQGSVVRLVLDPVEGQYVLSDLTSGPVLFATC